MKGRSLSILGIIAAAIGAVFILACNSLDMHILAIVCGTIFVASGLIDFVIFGATADKEDISTMSSLTSTVTIVIGVTMLAYAQDFVNMMPFILSILVGASAIWQFVTLGLATRPFQLPAWLYGFPLVLTAGAIYLFIIKDSHDDRLLMLSSGIALVVLGAGCILEGSALGMARRRRNREAAQALESQNSPDASPTAPSPADQTPHKKETAKHRTETTEDLDDEVI